MKDSISRRSILCGGAAASLLFLSPLGAAAASDDVSNVSSRDYQAHVAALREKFPEEKYAIGIEEPFVLIGDMPVKSLQSWARGTVRWAVKMLKAEYFSKDPPHILDIWLFRDQSSYESHNRSLFGSSPTTPYGYYSAQHKALVMNISTGGGTLVHEICHPFMAANFPLCPAWFNEGLASLYEQCQERDGRIWGLTNWRLRGLQASIGDRRVPKFKTLCETSSREFYDDPTGVHYAQARYLGYYLQEQGKLRDYYQAFHRTARQDPGGYAALQRILDVDDMDKFQKKWEAFVLDLRF